ncbi:MAG TPA: DUF3368 domain-containing protein [Phycisphaerales bacterium]|nr:DUF3368 domain-containing protein [Phycisphaerales bacterium]
MVVVSDTSPLRALQAVGLLHVLEPLYTRVLIPTAVARELVVPTQAVSALDIGSIPFLVVRSPERRLDLPMLGEGETEAISLAVEVSAYSIIVDDRRARQVAARMGLRTVGAAAILVAAKHRGLIDHVAPVLEELERKIQFRLSSDVRRTILLIAGELD